MAVLQSVRLLLPTAAAQQVPQPALASTRWPTLRHRSLRNERNELQTSYSFNEHSERRTSHLRSELVQRHSLTRRRAAGQPPVETVVQPRGMRPRWVPVTPASEPPRISPRHWLRSRRAQTVEMTLPWFNAIERRGMSRSQSQTVVEPRTPPAASLTWRNSVGANAGLASAPPASLPTPAPAPLSALTTVHHHPPQPQPQREAAPAGLNRAAIDRLAEDVMQRLERRVRIERERRGL